VSKKTVKIVFGITLSKFH